MASNTLTLAVLCAYTPVSSAALSRTSDRVSPARHSPVRLHQIDTPKRFWRASAHDHMLPRRVFPTFPIMWSFEEFDDRFLARNSRTRAPS